MPAQPNPVENSRSLRLAPIVVFAYMRADHLQRSIESLLANPEAASSEVLFFCDAAKRPEHQAGVDAVRAYVDSITGFRTITRVYRKRNFGLAASVIDGVTRVLGTHGQVIVLEDDLLVSPHFLRYMNDGLDTYRDDERVASVHGYVYPVEDALPETFFLQGADCWGWATWSRGWAHFDKDGTRLLGSLRERGAERHFDLDWQFPYTGMLKDQIAGRNSSWAILWHASCYLKGLLTLYPGRSLVENIGNDSSGTHCATTDAMSKAPSATPVHVGDIPVQPSDAARDAFIHFFRLQRTWQAKLRSSIKRALGSHA